MDISAQLRVPMQVGHPFAWDLFCAGAYLRLRVGRYNRRNYALIFLSAVTRKTSAGIHHVGELYLRRIAAPRGAWTAKIFLNS
jgi:hypothetical protein